MKKNKPHVEKLKKLLASVSSSTRRKKWAATILAVISDPACNFEVSKILMDSLDDHEIRNGITRGGSLHS